MQTKTLKILNNLQPDGLKSSDGNFKPRKKREPVSVGRVATYAVLGLYTLWIMAPFMIILISSFTPRSEFETATSFIWWPKEFSLEGYQRLFTNKTFNVGGIPMLLRGFLNTMWITLIPLASGLLQSLLVAYCYWQGKFPFKNSLTARSLAALNTVGILPPALPARYASRNPRNVSPSGVSKPILPSFAKSTRWVFSVIRSG